MAENHPLLAALEAKDAKTALQMIENGEDFRVTDQTGVNPLHLAAKHGMKEVLAALLERGAEVDAANVDGVTPLQHARRMGFDAMAALIAEGGGR